MNLKMFGIATVLLLLSALKQKDSLQGKVLQCITSEICKVCEAKGLVPPVPYKWFNRSMAGEGFTWNTMMAKGAEIKKHWIRLTSIIPNIAKRRGADARYGFRTWKRLKLETWF